MNTLKNLFLDQLAEMYETERELAETLERMAKLASNIELKAIIKVHCAETLEHASKVVRVFECFGEKATGIKEHATSQLLAEANGLVTRHKKSPASDAAIIEVIQKLEHIEIAMYGCLRDWARALNRHDAAVLLEEILDDEKSVDLKLTEVAHIANVDALGLAEWDRAAEDKETGALAQPESGGACVSSEHSP